MKQKLPATPSNVLKVFENLSDFAEYLDIVFDGYGIVITRKKGLFKPIEEKLWLTYSIVKSNDEYVVTFRFSGSLDPVSRVRIRGSKKACEIVSECISDKSICSYIDNMLKKLATNLDKIVEKMNKQTKSIDMQITKFTMSLRYAKVIDGLAEVTLSSLYLKYPLLERRKAKLDDVKNLDEFLDKIYKRYSPLVREVYVHVSDTNWMFILAVDLENMVYTPSFIEDTFRVVGKEAVERFLNKQEDYVTITILTMQS